MRSRRGFALLAVLWIIMGAAVMAMSLMLAARERVRTATNRNALARAEWAAEDCLARAIGALDGLLVGAPGSMRGSRAAPTDSLPLLLALDPDVRDCPGTIRLAPVGMSIDITSAPAEVLRRAVALQGFAAAAQDSMIDAILDWRDADDVARTSGCERDCYAALRREGPRNGPLADVEELARVRGFEDWGDANAAGIMRAPLDRLFTAEPGRVAISWAPFEVLAALPGIGTTGARDLVAFRQRSHAAFGDLASIAGALSPAARDSLAIAFDALSRLATVTPDAWIIVVTAPRASSGIEPTALSVHLVARAQLTATGVRIHRRRVLQ